MDIAQPDGNESSMTKMAQVDLSTQTKNIDVLPTTDWATWPDEPDRS
jgi:hypothetical protein